MRGTLQCELKSGGSCRGERGRGGGRGRGDVGVGQRQTNLSCPRAGSEARRALWVDMLGRSSRGAAGRCYDRRRYRSSEASWAGREGENSSTLASLGFFAAKFMPHLLLDPSHQRFGSRAVTQRRTRRATDRAAGYHTVARSMAGMCSPVLFHRRPAAPAFAFGERPRSEVVNLRWTSPMMCRARHPRAKGVELADLAVSGYLDRPHELQSG
jgi:hypothetical protein